MSGARVSLRVGAALVALVAGAAALSMVWTPYPVGAIDVAHRLMAPSMAHWLGSDAVGRDIFSELIAGARVSLLVGLIAVGLGALFGVALGLMAAFAGGLVDGALARLTDITFAFPAILKRDQSQRAAGHLLLDLGKALFDAASGFVLA